MPGGRRVIYIGGRRASVPDDQLQGFIRQLEQDGVEFSTEEPGAPEAGSPDEPGFNPWTGGKPPEDFDSFRKLYGDSVAPDPTPIRDALVDTGRGFAQGALAGGADELAAATPWATLDQARAQDQVSRERSPWLYHGAQALAGLPRNLATGFRGSLLQGAGEGVLGGNPDDAIGALKAAGGGAVTAGALHGLGEGVAATSGLANATARGFGNVANQARNAAFGGTPGDYQKAARLRGLDYVEDDLPQSAERLGLTNTLIPQSPSTYARKADALRKQAGVAEGAALDEAGQNVATYTPVDDLAEGLRRRGAGMRDGTLEGVAEESRMGDMADLLLRERGVPEYTLPEQPIRDAELNFDRGGMRDMTPFHEAYAGADPKQVADIAAGRSPTMNEGRTFDPIQLGPGQPGADDILWDGRHRLAAARAAGAPGILASYDYGAPRVMPLNEPASEFVPTGRIAPGSAGFMSPRELNTQKSAYYDRGYKQQGMSDATSALGAATNREAGSEARQQLLAALDYAPPGVKPRYEQAAQNYGEAATIGDMARNRAAANQASPQGQGFFGTLMQPATRFVKDYGPDAVANLATLGRNAFQGTGNALGAAAPYARGLAAGARPALTQGAGRLAAGADDNPPGDPLASGRGYLLPQVVADLARTNPRALGRFYPQIAQSMQAGDSTQLNALLERLEREPEWAQNYLPNLRARTAEGAGY